MIRSAILPVLGYLGYPLAVVGGVLIFASCSLLTLNMITANMGNVVTAIPASPDFNVAPVEQIGSLTTSSEPVAVAAVPIEPESSIVTVSPPDHSVAVALATPEDSSISDVEPPGLRAGQIGSQAVNVRSEPSKNGPRIGVLNAGAAVRMGANEGGWIHVYFDGGNGWVYQTYLAGFEG